jgi:hypothetical protein
MRVLSAVVVAVGVLALGVVLGSGVSGYALSPPNDACLVATEREGTTSEASWSFVPFGTRCEVRLDAGDERVVAYGPSLPAWIAWIVAMTALVGWAVRRPESRAVAGALAAAALITVCGLASHKAPDFAFTMWAAMVFGAPVAWLTRHVWMPAGERTVAGSLAVTAALVPVVFVVATSFMFFGNWLGYVGAVLGLAAGAAVSVLARRLWSQSTRPAIGLPSASHSESRPAPSGYSPIAARKPPRPS